MTSPLERLEGRRLTFTVSVMDVSFVSSSGWRAVLTEDSTVCMGSLLPLFSILGPNRWRP